MLRKYIKILTSLILLIVVFYVIKIISTPTSDTSITYTSSASTTTDISTSTTLGVKGPVTTSKPVTVVKATTATSTNPQTIISAPVNLPQTVSFDTSNDTARAALVNIVCLSNTADLPSISGSGVIVSPDGIIVTNAHIGQYWLLQNFNGQSNAVSCMIRSGSPAKATYKASLVYISPDWIQDNASLLTEDDPTGTGEHDYAFLKITSDMQGDAISTPLSYLQPDTLEDITLGDNILLASYPAEFLGTFNILNDLYQTSAIGQVSHVYTFSQNTTDLIDIPGTAVSQRGSSGGAAVNDQGLLTGIITTSSDATTTGARDLRAITTSYIDRDLETHQSISLDTLIENNDSIGDDFNAHIAPKLTDMLTAGIIQGTQ